MGAGNAGGGGGGSPNQMAKDKAKRDREEKKMTEEFDKIDKEIAKTKTTTPKDNNRDNEKVKVPKKKTDFKSVTKEVLNPNNNIQEKKKTPVLPPRDNDGGNNTTTTPKVKVPVIPKVDTAPTTVEVDQSSATDTTTVKEDDIYTRKKKAKARGRSMMTLTGPQGVKKDDKLTLGRPSLLGS